MLKGGNPYISVYRRFEQFLNKKFDIERRKAETDAELLERLRRTPGIPVRLIGDIEHFLREYHHARFGEKKVPGLENIVKLLN